MVSFPKRYQFHQIGTPPPSGHSHHHRLPPIFPYPSASLRGFFTSLRVTLTHFTLLSYERALRLPTLFPISGLARLGVKSKLCRSSWRAFASTQPLMLPSTCYRKALVACPPCPSWNLPSFMVESTVSTPCSRSDPPFSRQDAALAHLESLTPHDLVLWTDGSVSFLFGKGGSGVLANCSPCGTEATLSFLAGPVCSSFSVEFCTLLAGLGSTNKSAIFLLFYYLTLVLSSPPCPLLHLSSHLKLCGRSGRNCLLSPSVLSDYNGSPGQSFFPGNDAADELARQEALLVPSAVPCSLSSLISSIHCCLILD